MNPPQRLVIKWCNEFKPELIGAVSGGWPRILSNRKSLLETAEIALKG